MGFTTAIAILLAAVALGIYFFGIPPQLKRKMESSALQAMAENKTSYMVKQQIDKIPEADQPYVKELKQGLGQLSDSVVKNSLGGLVGETADEQTRPVTGR